MFSIPEEFADRMRKLYKEAGVAWIEGLPDLLEACQRRWNMEVGPPFLLSFNYVAPATRANGERVVLKAGFPNKERLAELVAMQVYAGRGMARLLEADIPLGVMLLERLEPGTMLTELAETDDEQATSIAAGVMRRLWQPAPRDHDFPTVADWAKGLTELREIFGGGTGPFPARLVEEAESLYADLLGSMAAPVLLHGDLHHFNILASERDGWLAIDPQGVVGEPAYETGTLLRNPDIERLGLPEAKHLQERRIAVLAEELGFDRGRIRGWAVAQAVLSAWWDYEAFREVGELGMACAEILASIAA